MSARITLEVVSGSLEGREFTFDDRTSCVIGRSNDCDPRLPSDEDHRTISRHHCLLDINPPEVRVRDFGSMNGTFVNGKKIGQREKGQSPEQAAQLAFPEHDLRDGDEITLGSTAFRVSVFSPAICDDCAQEIPEKHRGRCERVPNVWRCDSCHKKAMATGRNADAKKKVCACVRCGRDVSGEIRGTQPGVAICQPCQANPRAIIDALLKLAVGGDPAVSTIRGYSIERELGRGGMGAVYLANHVGNRRQVALKVMLPRVAANKRATEQFLREVDCTKSLDHLNVVKSYDSGCCDGTFFLTLEYCDGGSVDQLIQQNGGTLPLKKATDIILQTLDGLEYAHHASIRVRLKGKEPITRSGLVHRDLSPHNILLTGTGRSPVAKVGDYGLSKSFDAAGLSGLTRTGTVAGKPVFMPRQQVINFKYAKPEVDVWAAAACLYNMLTGAFPRDFPQGKDPWQTVLGCAAVPIRRRKSSIPRKLADVIDTALIDKPEIQFRAAVDLRQALEGAL